MALVFGRERTGLSNEELQLCHAAVHIPANPEYSSLNLAAAVQVLAYELRVALLAIGRAGFAGNEARQEAAASHAQMEGFFAQLGETLDDIDFHKGRAPDSAMRKLRRLFLRAGLNEQEVRLMRGILADAQRMARLAATKPDVNHYPRPELSASLTSAADASPNVAYRLVWSCPVTAGAPLLPGAAAAALPVPAGIDDGSVLVLGRISDDPKAHYEQLKPLLDYVVPRMRDVGIKEGRILMARDAQQMTSYLRRGRVDWVTETAGTGMQLQKRAGARPLLLTERGGVSRYHSVFFVRKDSGIRQPGRPAGPQHRLPEHRLHQRLHRAGGGAAGPGLEPGNTAVADGPADAGFGGLRVRAIRTQHRRLGAQAPGGCRRVQQPGLGGSRDACRRLSART